MEFKLKKIKLVVFDFDGVFTDGKCYFDTHNNVLKYYNVKDGMGLSILKKNNIKFGVISSYKTNKNVLFNDLKIDQAISDHLEFDFVYVGNKKNKLDVLNEWMKELGINYENIAYLGDDINDIPIMKIINFSGCPNDATQECKNIVDYCCNKKGGDGCVREFIDVILGRQKYDVLQEIRREFNHQIENFDFNYITTLVKLINEKNGVYFSGVGKSETIAHHCCNLLKSINVNAHFLHPINALHGDIGSIKENDMIILFSKSGNTIELLNIIPPLKNKKCYIVGVCCDDNSKFLKLCDLVIKLPFNNEISGNINKIPTNSFMSQLIFCNIVVSEIKKNITLDQYYENHPFGNIGNSMKKIKDCVFFDFPKIMVTDEILLINVLLEMTKYKFGCCFFINEKNELLGILTDGDIRRLLTHDINKKILTINDINKNYYHEKNIEKYISECKKYNYIPIIIKEKLYGVVSLIN